MKRGVFFCTVLLWSVGLSPAFSAEAKIEPMLSTGPAESTAAAGSVMSVYGISADDYLPENRSPSKTASARQGSRAPQVRSSGDHPSLNLPDGFFFIGGLICMVAILWLMVTFISEFEERRKEELRGSAIDQLDIE